MCRPRADGRHGDCSKHLLEQKNCSTTSPLRRCLVGWMGGAMLRGLPFGMAFLMSLLGQVRFLLDFLEGDTPSDGVLVGS
jgi:hypothetical protein